MKAFACALLVASVGCKRSVEDDGGALFASACARCHGSEGAGGVALVDGGPSPRNFRDHAFHLARTDEQLKQTIFNGKGAGMPAFGTMFNDTQRNALVAHVRSLDSRK